MPVTIVVGAQYGGEGKGKVVAHLARRDRPEFVVRCGGPNSGHTVEAGGQTFRLRMLPAGFISSRTRLLLPAGSIIRLDLLFSEMDLASVDRQRVGIDRNAILITEKEGQQEAELGLRSQVGSTLSGTGMAVANRALRRPGVKLAVDEPQARQFITDVSAEVNAGVDRGELCIIEGTQGFGLSLYHALCYPYATSRDTTASAFLSEVGVSPLTVTSVVMAVRTFPIRVEGNSGPLKGEITWEELQHRCHYPHPIGEYSTVTQRLRRVAQFDLELVRRAATVNRPTEIALHGADYVDFKNKGVTSFCKLTKETIQFVDSLENQLRCRVSLIGTGADDSEMVDKGCEIVPDEAQMQPQATGCDAYTSGG